MRSVSIDDHQVNSNLRDINVIIPVRNTSVEYWIVSWNRAIEKRDKSIKGEFHGFGYQRYNLAHGVGNARDADGTGCRAFLWQDLFAGRIPSR